MSRMKNVPTNATTLRTWMIALLKESIPHMEAFRDKEWAMRELERYEKPQSLEGKTRNIKATGVVRPVDELGRIVVPIEVRRKIGMDKFVDMEISIDEVNKWIVLERHKTTCHFCPEDVDVHEFKNRYICERCLTEMVNEL